MIFILGVGAQWLAWRLHIPSILLLLLAGFLAGPFSGIIDTDAIFGSLLFPIVSISVAIILFEGGLTLRISELKGFGGVVRNLVTIGVVVTWVVSTLGAYYILNLELSIAILLGAVLVVTGPTVIIPLLRHVRPKGHLGPILKWEGIVVDPIGAMLAVLVFEAIVGGGLREHASLALIGVLKTLVIGGLIGAVAAFCIVFLLKRYWIPDFLQNPVALMFVVLAFTLSNHFQAESGLLAVTIMGIALANQGQVTVKHIVEFKENLRVLLIAGLFIILAARLSLDDLSYISISSLAFLALLIVLARPLSVYLSTIGSGLAFKERFFLMAMAPRGIIAAAIASVFALRLSELGYAGAELLVPLTFMVIIGTVVVYGLLAAPIAARLDLARPDPQGLLIAGAHPWARAIGTLLKEEGFEVMLVDSNWGNIIEARMAGLSTYYGSVLSESLLKDVELGGIGRLLAITFNDNVNSLAAIHFTDAFGRKGVYQIAPEDEKTVSQELRGRLLFATDATYVNLSRKFRRGGGIKATRLTEEFGFEAFLEHNKDAVPLLLIDDKKKLKIFAIDSELKPKSGQTLISLVRVEESPLAG
jgi:NhaP-type Na+/H+ or K+/H+ antiporter